MSYTLTPIVVDLRKIKDLMGSKDVAVLQAVIKKYRKDMLNVDAMGSDYEEFEDEIKSEYKRFVNGDFSGVDLKAVYPEPKEEEDDEDDEEAAELKAEYERLKKTDPKAAEKYVLDYLKDAFESEFDDEDEDEEDEDEEDEDDEEIEKQVTTGAALAQLILGGNTDKSLGFKYGYALHNLCEYFGEVPMNEHWCTIRYRSLEAIDALLKKAGIKSNAFSASGFLVERGVPIEMPSPDDFPGIGYLTRDEARQVLSMLDPDRIQKAIDAEDDDQDWFQGAMDELRKWLEMCVKTNRDLVCFYF